MRIFRDPISGTKFYSYGAPSDSKDMRVSFTSSDVADGSANSWTNVTPIASGEKHSSLFAKISQMFKNVRYLYKLLGTTDISGLGSNVSGAIDNLGDIIVKGVETTSTASQAYAVNEYMIYNKKLYKVKAAIASGATITVGTNIESANTNVGNELTSLRSSLSNKISIAHSGSNYVTFSNGLQICWGTVTTGSNTYGSASFGRAFSSAPTLQATAITENATMGYFAQIKSDEAHPTTGCIVHGFYAGNNQSGPGANLTFNYLAIGFASI